MQQTWALALSAWLLGVRARKRVQCLILEANASKSRSPDSRSISVSSQGSRNSIGIVTFRAAPSIGVVDEHAPEDRRPDTPIGHRQGIPVALASVMPDIRSARRPRSREAPARRRSSLPLRTARSTSVPCGCDVLVIER